MVNETGRLSIEEAVKMTEELELNLSDFALFLSVMKYKPAHEAVLSIIMNEENLELSEVKVEQVVLNKSGKRAIRLDAWALDTKNRQFSTEMQNDTAVDDVRKRSRYYQGLLDTPILKSGKSTRYKQLPSTVIIFITQEDIWGLDRVKYTFTEQCKEVRGLELEDGTQKIFLNMKSKNGNPELVSLLQYMKKTDINNPDILVKDKRIGRLNEVVTEVKQSEEWEAVQMNILEVGIQKGREQGLEQGISRGELLARISLVRKKQRKGLTPKEIAELLEENLESVQKIFDSIQKYPAYSDDEIADLF